MKTKKSKRIISLILALTMMFTFMAMSASAATTEIQPRGACPLCGSADTRSVTYLRSSETYSVSGCSKIATAHSHLVKRYEVVTTCIGCGRTTSSTYTTTTCC